MRGSHQPSRAPLGRRAFRLAVVVGGTVVAAATAGSVVFASGLVTPHHAAAAVHLATPPTAAQVEQDLADVTNAHSQAIGTTARIGYTSCVQGDPGSYVCSFVRVTPPAPAVCAVAMLKWTPKGLSTYTVEQAGKVALPVSECGPVKRVLHVLGTSR